MKVLHYNIFKQKTLVFQLFLFLFVNGLFVVKYVSRTNINPALILTLYLVAVVLIFLFALGISFKKISEKTIRTLYLCLICVTICGILVLHMVVNPSTIQVDRWSAIHNFIQTLFMGDYPYLAQTHLGGYGSPFPFWQFFHIPFYLLGNVGLGMLFIFILMALTLKWIFISYKKAIIYLILVIISPSFWYEVLVRSDLMYNFILCLILILIIHKKHITIKTNPTLLGVLCGLLLSTRLSVVIPIGIYLIYDFWSVGWKSKISFIIASLTTFIVTFIPLLIWNFDALLFFEYNPFVLQSRQGSFYEIIFLILMIIIFGIKSKNDLSKKLSYIGITIILFVGFTFFHLMIKDNFLDGIFSSRYDITYFNMALPFIIYTLADKSKLKSPLTPSLSNS